MLRCNMSLVTCHTFLMLCCDAVTCLWSLATRSWCYAATCLWSLATRFWSHAATCLWSLVTRFWCYAVTCLLSFYFQVCNVDIWELRVSRQFAHRTSTPWVPNIEAVIMFGSYTTHLIVSFVCSLDWNTPDTWWFITMQLKRFVPFSVHSKDKVTKKDSQRIQHFVVLRLSLEPQGRLKRKSRQTGS